MDFNALKEKVESKLDDLSFGIGFDINQLREMGYDPVDTNMIFNAKEVGEVKIEGDTIKANGLAAGVLSRFFLELGDDTEYSLEKEIKERDLNSLTSFHFFKYADSPAWQFYRTSTRYDHGKVADVFFVTSDFEIRQIFAPADKSTDLNEFTKYLIGTEKEFTSSVADYFMSQYRFQRDDYRDAFAR